MWESLSLFMIPRSASPNHGSAEYGLGELYKLYTRTQLPNRMFLDGNNPHDPIESLRLFEFRTRPLPPVPCSGRLFLKTSPSECRFNCLFSCQKDIECVYTSHCNQNRAPLVVAFTTTTLIKSAVLPGTHVSHQETREYTSRLWLASSLLHRIGRIGRFPRANGPCARA